METLQALCEREVIAPTVRPHSRGIGKDEFEIDVANDRVRCPMGHETDHWTWVWTRPGKGRAKVRVKRFAFDREVCRACPRFAQCVHDKRRRGRFVTLHHDEARLQAARAFERTEQFHQQYRQRVVVEHRIARLVQLGVRKSRYFGGAKTLLQMLLAATVANLTLVAGGVRDQVRDFVAAAVRSPGAGLSHKRECVPLGHWHPRPGPHPQICS